MTGGAGGRQAEGGVPHVIRLRGPWRTADGVRVPLPAAWHESLPDMANVELSRPFNWVRGREGNESVTLRIASAHEIGPVLVNGSVVADRGDIRPLLAASNLLTVELSRRDRQASILEAWLEIAEQRS